MSRCVMCIMLRSLKAQKKHIFIGIFIGRKERDENNFLDLNCKCMLFYKNTRQPYHFFFCYSELSSCVRTKIIDVIFA